MAQITLNSSGVASNGTLALQSNGTTTAVTIDASQNVGIGTTPSAWGSTAKAVQLPNGCAVANLGAGDVVVTQNAYFDNPNFKYASTTGVGSSAYRQIDGTHRWFYAASGTAGNNITFTEAMRIDSSGNLLVGTTNTEPRNLSSGSGIKLGNGGIEAAGSGDTNFINITSASGNMLLFRRQANSVGAISTNGTTTTYGTMSDYRLKNTIAPMTGALAKVALLKPCTYKWNVDGSDGEGFIAHELQAVCPDAVTGEKDGEQMQGVDYGKLTPILTAALQEAIAKIETLEARIAVLEAK